MAPFDPKHDPRAFRDALGAFATGVTVVTAASTDGPVGITANSFASVSLDPPLVLWSPAKDSPRYHYFVDAPHFSIHVLDGHQQAICDAFTRSMTAFDGLDWETGPHDVPQLQNCLARFDCAQEARYDGGDHTILIGRVLGATSRPGLPLLFQAGRFVSFKG